MKVKNETKLDFTDISSEASRQYVFPDRETLTIKNPVSLHISARGGHRVCDAQGTCYYVACKWLYITWTPKQGQPHFVK